MNPGSQLELVDISLLKDRSYIDGEWISGKRSIEVVNPATGVSVGSVPDLGGVETTAAIDAASCALPAWRAMTGKARAAILQAWHALIQKNQSDLATIMTAEQGKPLLEAKGEVAYASSFIEWYAEEAKRVNGAILAPHLADRRLLVRKQSVGVVAAVTPWNFPLAMVTRKVGPALAAGCTMVLKPSDLTPLSALALAELAHRAGVPRGVFNVVTGRPTLIGDAMIADKRVRKFTFTGSTAVGKRLAARCMDTVKRISLELGGNAPFIVFEDADIGAAAAGAIASKYRNTGQTCVCANRILVHAQVHDQFVEALARMVKEMVVGDGLVGPTDQGPLISLQAIAKVEAHVADAVNRGAKVLLGGKRLDRPGFFFEPTVLTDIPEDALLCQEETFGPVAGIIKFNTEAEAIRVANNTPSGLASYIYTKDHDRAWRVTEALEFGMVGLNTGLISTEVAPFGGIKESGLGREGAADGIEEYLDTKLVCAAIRLH